MITLLTGVPGSGKTSKIVYELQKETTRPIFVMGIPDLLLPHIPAPPVADWTVLEPAPEDPSIKRPSFTFPQNAIVVIDEAQNVYRPRPSGSKVPDIVAAFETHRHKGIDFYLLTQHPSLLDANIKRLVSKHWHVHVTPFGRRLLEWSQSRDPDSKSDRADAVSVPYKPPRSVFKLYKSSELHTKLKRRVPNSFILFAVAVPLALVLAYYAYYRISARIHPDKPATALSHPPLISPTASSPNLPPGAVPFNVDAYVPKVPDHPETAPLYDPLRVVKVMPVISGCISTVDHCACYTQQNTRAEISETACRAWVSNRPFNPYMVSSAETSGAVAPGGSAVSSPLQPAEADKQPKPLPRDHQAMVLSGQGEAL